MIVFDAAQRADRRHDRQRRCPGDNRYAVAAYSGAGETGDVATIINDAVATIVKPLAE